MYKWQINISNTYTTDISLVRLISPRSSLSYCIEIDGIKTFYKWKIWKDFVKHPSNSPKRECKNQQFNFALIAPLRCHTCSKFWAPYCGPTGHMSRPPGFNWVNKTSGVLGAAAPTCMMSYGACSAQPFLPSPSKHPDNEQQKHKIHYSQRTLSKIEVYQSRRQNYEPTMMRSLFSMKLGSSALIFLIASSTNSGWCSIPTTILSLFGEFDAFRFARAMAAVK